MMVDFLEQFLNYTPTKAQSAVDAIVGEYDSDRRIRAIAENRRRVAEIIQQQQGLSGAISIAGSGLEEMASNPMQDQGSRFLASFLNSYGNAKQAEADAVFKDAFASGDYETALKIATDEQARQVRQAISDKRNAEIQERGADLAERKFGLAEKEFGVNAQLAKQQMDVTRQQMGLNAKKYDLEVKKLQKEIEAGGRDPGELFDDTQKLRKEFVVSAEEFENQRDSYGRVTASASDPSPAGDLALIFNYMKVLDPGSTVREGEFANAQNSGNVPTKVQALYNSVTEGTRLTDAQRKDFVGRAEKIYRKSEAQHQQRADIYVGLAEAAGLDPKQVVIDLGLAAEEEKVAPDAGKKPRRWKVVE